MISGLFKHLHPKSLAARSMMNKSWQSVAFKLNSQVATSSFNHQLSKWYHSNRMVATSGFARHRSKWYHSDRMVRQDEVCLKFADLADQPSLSNLKHLALCDESPEFDLNKLNRFSQLMQLEIDGCLGEKAVNLNLPELEVLAIHRENDRCPLSIDCPELSVLAYRGEPEDASLLNVKYPEVIRKLETNMFGPKLAPFENVECLVTKTLFALNEDTLLSLPRLKELRCTASIMELEDELEEHGSHFGNEIERVLWGFLNSLKELRRSDVEFIVSGLRISEIMLDKIEFFFPKRVKWVWPSDEYFYIRNHRLVEPDETLDFIERLNYSILMDKQVGMAPKSFFQKFTSVKEVKAGDAVEYPSHFLCFLKSLSSLKILDLQQSGLEQDFYDQLPASAPLLVQLGLQERAGARDDEKHGEYMFVDNDQYELQLNFDFIGKLSHLSRVYIHQDLTFESMSSLIRWADKLEVVRFQFSVDEKRFIIEKKEGAEEFEVFSDELLKTKNPVEILEFFEELQGGEHEAKKP